MAYVNPLDATTPLGSDPVSQGDDMFRSVKAALIERIDSFFTGHDVQPWQAKSGSGAASLWIVSDAIEAVTRLAYTGAGSRSVELFANATVAGLRDTTGPLTILSYTYSSALTVLNTTGSMQLKVGVGQTIQTVVNGVTIGTWSSTGFTANVAISVPVSGTPMVLGSNTASSSALHINTANANSAFIAFDNAGVTKWGVGRGVSSGSDNLELYNYVVGSVAMTLASATSAVTFSNGITVSASGIAVTGGVHVVTGGIAIDAAGLTVSGGSVAVSSTIAAGTYGLQVNGGAGAARDILQAGQSGVSNGFTVQWSGAAMVYTFNGLGTGAMSVGNADSGGVGFRLLRVPN